MIPHSCMCDMPVLHVLHAVHVMYACMQMDMFECTSWRLSKTPTWAFCSGRRKGRLSLWSARPRKGPFLAEATKVTKKWEKHDFAWFLTYLCFFWNIFWTLGLLPKKGPVRGRAFHKPIFYRISYLGGASIFGLSGLLEIAGWCCVCGPHSSNRFIGRP